MPPNNMGGNSSGSTSNKTRGAKNNLLSNPETPKTPGYSRQLLAAHSLIETEDAELDINLLLKLMLDVFRREEVPRCAAALGEGVVVLLMAALKAEGDKAAALSGKLDSISSKVDGMLNFTRATELATLETQADVRAFFEQTEIQKEDTVARLTAAVASQSSVGTELTSTTSPPRPSPQPTIHDLKEADARVELRSRRVLVEPGVNSEELKSLAVEVLRAKFNHALEEARKAVGSGPTVSVMAVDKLPRGGVVFVLNSSEAAAWICLPDVAAPFAAALGDVSFRGQEAQVLVEKLPLRNDLAEPATLREIESTNGLGNGTLLKIEWIKPPHRRDPGQQFGHAKFTLRSNDMADLLINNRCYIWNQIATARRLADEPMRCSKCQRFGHKRAHAAKCKAKNQICSSCGGEHENKACPDHKKVFCVNCDSDDHASHNRTCPAFRQERDKMNARRPENTRRLFGDLPSEMRVPARSHPLRLSQPSSLPRSGLRQTTLGEGASFRYGGPRTAWGARGARAPSPERSQFSTTPESGRWSPSQPVVDDPVRQARFSSPPVTGVRILTPPPATPGSPTTPTPTTGANAIPVARIAPVALAAPTSPAPVTE
ncbi:hypothetical protein RSOLAG1IB_08778 [Rhizoctonia solani AG-1 IB]|uniref:Uncharacterized protein n=1 Tax=Thanatephorus cucumeris (strain AG1-IB / isolate 7/3/14) TaxID=1108050 RepID=M5CAE8_THACB|nr:hypothetical protein BN14_11127 [Rhizoctonia solani AG-1 IB]CEL58732.1 hypothetical protein RSOLAG1IB_08778 [Rhizoctonia solani AG-1 IB]